MSNISLLENVCIVVGGGGGGGGDLCFGCNLNFGLLLLFNYIY